LLHSSPAIDALVCGRRFLVESDLLIYCGHGSGEKYLHRDKIRGIESGCSAALLFGCSSGRLESEGIFGPDGAVLSYLRAGSPGVLAMLWDVTDKDIDQLSVRVLQQWLLPTEESEGAGERGRALAHVVQASRDACKLRFLNGHAAVCYGLPLHVSTGDD
jgi:separase